MNENIKISESELAEIKMLQGKFNEIILKLGNLGVERIELDQLISECVAKEKELRENWINLKKLDSDLMNNIIKKYGEGSLDVSNGTFIPSKI